jgi:hypothetical protein
MKAPKPMRRLLLCLAVFIVVFPGVAGAHRLDEYLQATRISIESGRIGVEMNLTPGADVAESVIATIDQDRDGEISAAEIAVYAGSIVTSASLEIDSSGQALALEKYQFPSVEQMRRGEGIIRLYAAAKIPPASAGRHRLLFSNRHRSDIGVYLVNALVPVDERISINGQSRDFLQREFDVEYTVASPVHSVRGASVSSGVGIALAAVCYALSRRYGLSIGG